MKFCSLITADLSALPLARDPIYDKLLSILKSRVEERSGARVIPEGGQFTLHFALSAALSEEAYTISDLRDGLLIEGGSFRGLMFGLGKLLHTSHYDEAGVHISDWRGTSAPDCPLRVLYFALHFYNSYHTMNAEGLIRVLEDSMLWGFNGVCATYTRMSLHSYDDPRAEPTFHILEALFAAAKALTMTTTIFNNIIDFMDTVPELAADRSGIHGKAGNALCPSKPAGFDRIAYNNLTVLRRLAPIGVDHIIFFPYDEGGCSCPQCAPWGGNGYYHWAHRLHRLICQEIFPAPKAILSTWHFDLGINDPRDFPWLDRNIRQDKEKGDDWVSYIMLETRRGIPDYIASHGVPGGVPAIDFPEITMRMLEPWGGWGANPLPTEVERMWRQMPGLLQGGICYSEGIYDEINKAVMGSLLWDRTQHSRAIFDDYCGYEFRPGIADDLWELSILLERNQFRTHYSTLEAPDMDEVERIRVLGEKMDTALPQSVRTGWRWRIFYIRSLLDYERYTAGQPFNWKLDELDIRTRFRHWGQFLVGNKKAQAALHELIRIYNMPEDYDPAVHILHHTVRPIHTPID